MTASQSKSKPSGRWRFSRSVSLQHAVVVHALHKSASMFIHTFFEDLCRRMEVPYYSIHNSPPDHEHVPAAIETPFVIAPIRSFDIASFEFPKMDRVEHLFQVRDPRDILVSEYYSLGWIHADGQWSESEKRRRETIREMTIDEFVIQESEVNKYPLWDRYCPILAIADRTDVTLVRYEDMVLRFDEWLSSVLQSLELKPFRRWHRRLRRCHSDAFEPALESGSHKRNVVPGDHQSKLKPDTIAVLNRRFEPVLKRFNYWD